jgi:Rha family phage regulatory protein
MVPQSVVIVNKVEVHLVTMNGKVFCNSLDVSKVFEKPHNDVLKKIRLFSERALGNFSQSSYINEQNKSQPMYEMNRDGFMFLAMGFTGEKAENWKLDLIDAFNQMEQELHKPMTVEMLLEQNMKMIQVLQSNVTMLTNKITEDKPLVSYAQSIVGSVTPISLRDWISSLKSDLGLMVGERKVIDYLIEEKYIYRDKKGNLRAYSNYYESVTSHKGYFNLIPVSTATPKGNREFVQLKVTGLGQLELGNEVVEYFSEKASA